MINYITQLSHKDKRCYSLLISAQNRFATKKHPISGSISSTNIKIQRKGAGLMIYHNRGILWYNYREGLLSAKEGLG